MNKLISLLLISFAATSVYAADDCASRAAEKKLAGAAKNSFMKNAKLMRKHHLKILPVLPQPRKRSWLAPPRIAS